MAGPISRDLVEFDNQGRAIYFNRETGAPSHRPSGYYPSGAGPTLLQDMTQPRHTQTVAASLFDQDFPEKKGPLAPSVPQQEEFPTKSHIPAGAIPGSPGTNPDTPSWALPFAGQPQMSLREGGARVVGGLGAAATAPVTGPLGAAARIGVGAGAGAIRDGAQGAFIQGLINAIIEGGAPVLGAVLKSVPGVRHALPVRPGTSHESRTWSQPPWAGTSQTLPTPQGPTPSPILNPAGRPARMIEPPPAPIPGPAGPPVHMTRDVTTMPPRPYMPNLPPMLRALLEAAANSSRGQRAEEP
jgi:hypothetical protein